MAVPHRRLSGPEPLAVRRSKMLIRFWYVRYFGAKKKKEKYFSIFIHHVFGLFQTSMELNRPPLFALPSENVPPIIERDEAGRPVRRGYVPVEEKIQKELREMRSRESELKRLRRNSTMRQSQPDLLDDIDDAVE